ncbi:tetratricopeptide repeat protein [Avibacterium avium]|uniref:tetratricopeptide repeat protein n=1 Tax=Avibacterium avium TaxID=751 RepID=UPI003BF902A2
MKFTKTLLTTALLSFALLGTTQVAYADFEPETQFHAASARETQFQQALDAANKNDFATALKLWKPLAEQGDASAQFNLGLMYANGQGVKQDKAEAAKWYRKAAEQGDVSAQFNLGLIYHIYHYDVEGVKWYRKAAEQGNASAQFNLGFMYWGGDLLKQDYFTAIEWFRKAAAQGDGLALHLLGFAYLDGNGVKQDKLKAKEYFGKACEIGIQEACFMLELEYGKLRDILEKPVK